MSIHKHDCSNCISLGEFNGEDLYYHPGKPFSWTLISRWGEDGQYSSGSHISKLPQLVEARRRATEQGFIKEGETT